MRRTALQRGTKPLRRTTRLRARGNTTYSRRERDFGFMGFVKRRTCFVREVPPSALIDAFSSADAADRWMKSHPTPCSGPIEADHMGARGMGQKAADSTCVPMCSSHHQQRHAHNGAFKHLNRDELRAWRALAIATTQAAWSAR